ncbi:hypothetical protein [Telluribacter humicola]|uniref:hypothetical protein n=1 Tax=Telluribacter humicola TaxID=1720261 RepID=UPI001A96BF7B|nr:hypothetical protein [Telluribacter humicola]
MKTLRKALWMLLWLPYLLVHPVHGQVTEVDTTSKSTHASQAGSKFSVGLDVFKNIPLWLQGNKAPIFIEDNGTQHDRLILEVALRKKIDEAHHAVALLGYTQLDVIHSRGTQDRNQIKGWYIKGGKERPMYEGGKQAHIGLLGMATFCQYHTYLRYSGPTYGDYTEHRLINNIGIGAEPYFAFDFFPDSRWMLRWVTRLNFHYRLFGEGYTPYYPGIGITTGYNFTMSAGTTLQLHY